jgi:hypothetical protein
MLQGKTLIIVLVTLVVGFTGGFILRPVIMPPANTTIAVSPAPAPAAAAQARGTQYFVAHIDEARQVVAACRDGTVRGDECANAETAVITVESKERFRRFRGDR